MNIVTLINNEKENNPRIALYHNIANAIAKGISTHILKSGTALPTHRKLAYDLGVTVGTVSRAYAEATRRQLTVGITGRGTFINAPSQNVDILLEKEKISDLSFIYPFEYLNPPLEKILQKISSKNDLSMLMCCHEPRGLLHHREAGAKWAGRFGVRVGADSILITAGAQHALLVLLSALFQVGDKIVAEPLTYPLLKQLSNRLCLTLVPARTDQAGILPDSFEALCKGGEIRGIYLMPTCQSPTLAQIPDYRRREIVAICRKYNVLIIEDDVYALSLEKHPEPIINLAPERSFFIASTSESLSGGLRVAYICAPDAFYDTVEQAIGYTVSMVAPLMAEIACHWIEDGTADNVLWAKREEAAMRNVLARRILDGFALETRSTGFFAWLKLPMPWSNENFTKIAMQKGLRVANSSHFALPSITPEPAIRLSLGGVSEKEELTKALTIIAEILNGNADL